MIVGILICIPAAAALVFVGVFLSVCICAKLPRRAEKADVLVVLGARVRPDGRLSRNLQRRCETAMDAWKRECAPSVLVCGGISPGDPGPEADYMRAFLLERGLPERAVLVERTSANTVENLQNARTIMKGQGMTRALIVTSDYHLTRSLWIARALGMEAGGIGAPSPRDARSFLKVRFRETLSWFLYFIHRINRNERLS